MNALTPGIVKVCARMAYREVMQLYGKTVLSQERMIRQKLQSSLETNWISCCSVGRSLMEFWDAGKGMQKRTRRIPKAVQ